MPGKIFPAKHSPEPVHGKKYSRKHIRGKNAGFLTRFLGFGIFLGRSFWDLLGDFWMIVWDVLDCFSYSFGVFLGGLLEGFYGIFLDCIFWIVFFRLDFFPYNTV